MAAKESSVHDGDCCPTAVQTIVNRWVVDYYASLALVSLQKERYTDFCRIKNVLDRFLDHFVASPHTMPKIQVLRLLSCIYEGARVDESPVPDQSATPLETALMLLECMEQDLSIPQQDFDNACMSIKDMIVVNCIKSNKFDIAKQMLIKHFPSPMVGKNATLMCLINQRRKSHNIIEQSDFPQFKKEMLAFCQRICPFRVPFLQTAARKLIDETLKRQNDEASGLNEQGEPGPSSRSQSDTGLPCPCKQKIIPKTRLEAAFNLLCLRSDRTFAGLEEEVEREEQMRREDLLLHLSPSLTGDSTHTAEQEFPEGPVPRGISSPMEASPADHPPQTDVASQSQASQPWKSPAVQRQRWHNTVAELVMEPDSITSSQSTTASQEIEVEAVGETPQSPNASHEDFLQNPLRDSDIGEPSRTYRRRAKCLSSDSNNSPVGAALSNGEEDPQECSSSHSTPARKKHNQSINPLRKNSDDGSDVDSLDGSPAEICLPDPQASATPKKRRNGDQGPSHSKLSDSTNSHVGAALSDGEEDPQESSSSHSTPAGKKHNQSINPVRKNLSDVSSLDGSPADRQTCTTPKKRRSGDQGPSHSEWAWLMKNAKETKETWSDDESAARSRNSASNVSDCSYSGHRKRKWSDKETDMLKEGVRKFGEGNWGMIKKHYDFAERTNVNLKDRWRTMKKLKLV